MTDKELYDIIMEDETLQKYLDNNQFKKLYRYIKKAGNNGDMSFMDLSFAEFTAFLRAADIDVFECSLVIIVLDLIKAGLNGCSSLSRLRCR